MPAVDRYQRAFDGVNDLVKSIHLQSDTVGRILAYSQGGKLSDIFLEYIQTQLTNEPSLPKEIGVHRYASILTLIKGKAASNMSNLIHCYRFIMVNVFGIHGKILKLQ